MCKKKIKRIYSHVIITETVMLAIYLMFDIKKGVASFIGYIIHIFLLQSVMPVSVTEFAYCLNEPLWYLSMIIMVWFVTPLINGIKNKISIKSFVLLIAYFCIVMVLIKDMDLLRYYTYVCPVMWVIIYFCFAYLNKRIVVNEKIYNC